MEEREDDHWWKLIYGSDCCPPSKLIKVIAWIQIVVYSITTFIGILALFIRHWNTSDFLAMGLLLLTFPVAIFLPIGPAFIFTYLVRNSMPNTKWPIMSRGGGDYFVPYLLCTIIFITISDLFAALLLIGCKKKHIKSLKIWRGFAAICFISVTIESLIIMGVAIETSTHNSKLWWQIIEIILTLFIREGGASVIFLLPMGGVQLFIQDLNLQNESQNIELESHLICSSQPQTESCDKPGENMALILSTTTPVN